ncbi:hypothetical protein [Streptomyces katsurahamanus]|nr:hypothetical protein [Streptomyces katsurahamanus]
MDGVRSARTRKAIRSLRGDLNFYRARGLRRTIEIPNRMVS